MQSTDILIWTVDAGDAERLPESASALAEVLGDDSLPRSTKLVVVATKQDLPHPIDATDLWEKLCEEQSALREEFTNRNGTVLGITVNGGSSSEGGLQELLQALEGRSGKRSKSGSAKQQRMDALYTGPRHVIALFDHGNLFSPQGPQPPQFVFRRIADDGDDDLLQPQPVAVAVVINATSMDALEAELPKANEVFYYLQAISENEPTKESFSQILRLYVIAVTGDGPTPDGVEDLRHILKPMCDFMKFSVLIMTTEETNEFASSVGPDLLKKLDPKHRAKRALELQLVREAKALRAVQLAERAENPTTHRLLELHSTNVLPVDAAAAEQERRQGAATRRERRKEAMQRLSDMLSKVESPPVSDDNKTTKVRLTVAAATEGGGSVDEKGGNPRIGVKITTLPNTVEAFAAQAQRELRGVSKIQFRRDETETIGMLTIIRGELRDDAAASTLESLEQEFNAFDDQSKVSFRVVEEPSSSLVDDDAPPPVVEQKKSSYDYFSSYNAPAEQQSEAPQPPKATRRFVEAIIGTYKSDPIKEVFDDLAESALPELQDARANAAHFFLRYLSAKMSLGGNLSSALGDPKALVHTLLNGGSLHLVGDLPLNHRELFFRQAIFSLCEGSDNSRLVFNNPVIASIIGDSLASVRVDVRLNNPGTIAASALKETFTEARYALAASTLQREMASAGYHSTALEEATARAATSDFTFVSGERVKSIATALLAEAVGSDSDDEGLRAIARISLKFAPLISRLTSVRELTGYYTSTAHFEGLDVPAEHIPSSIRAAVHQSLVQQMAAVCDAEEMALPDEQLLAKIHGKIEPDTDVATMTAAQHDDVVKPEVEVFSQMESGIDMSELEDFSKQFALTQNIAPRHAIPLVAVVGSTFDRAAKFVQCVAPGRVVLPFPSTLFSSDNGAKGSFVTFFDPSSGLQIEITCANTAADAGPLSKLLSVADSIVLVMDEPSTRLESDDPVVQLLGKAAADDDERAAACTLLHSAQRPEDSSALRRLALVVVGEEVDRLQHQLSTFLPPNKYQVTAHAWDGSSDAEPRDVVTSSLSNFSKPQGKPLSAWDGY